MVAALAHARMKPSHERMPLILLNEGWERWLCPHVSGQPTLGRCVDISIRRFFVVLNPTQGNLSLPSSEKITPSEKEGKCM